MNLRTKIRIAGLNFKDAIEFNSAMHTVAKSRKAEANNEIDNIQSVAEYHKNKMAEASKRAAEKQEDLKPNKTEEKVDKSEKKPKANTSEEKAKEKSTDQKGKVENANIAASSAAIPYVKDSSNPNVIDLGFGVTIDQNAMNGDPIPQQSPQYTPQHNPVMNANNYVQQQQAQQFVHPNMPFFQHPTVNAVGMFMNDNERKAYAEDIAYNLQRIQPGTSHYAEKLYPQRGMGNHKVDMPKPQKPPLIKAEVDKVEMDGLNDIKVETNPPKPEPKTPEIISNKLEQPTENVLENQPPIYDNSELTSKYRYLEDIEKIASKMDIALRMCNCIDHAGSPNGLIEVYVFTNQSEPNPYKCFTVDTGIIIDRRAKIFPGLLQRGYGYEDFEEVYPVLISKPDEEKGKSKSKNIINEQLFIDIFTGGFELVKGKHRSMYTQEYLQLNRYVDLSTMPTHSMNSNSRKAVRDRLLAALQAGVFTEALKQSPNSRFIFSLYDKKLGTFSLTNKNVPYRYCGPYMSNKNVGIFFGLNNQTEIKSGI